MIDRVVPPPPSLSRGGETMVAAALVRAADQLRPVTDSPRPEAELLLAHVLNRSRADLYTHPERPLTRDQLANFQRLLDQRAACVPLPYLTGHVEFFGLDMNVDRRVFVPRPETETLVELALTRTPRTRIADVGTGSGCIAIALAVNAPQSQIYTLDISPDALAVARANAERHGVADRITFIESDLLAALPEPVDLIVANPPYISANEWPALPSEVGEHEPRLALYGGPDGLDVIRRLFDQTPDHLRPGGSLLIEIGATQGPAAKSLARRAFPTANVVLQTDLAVRDRVLCIQTQRDEEFLKLRE